MSESDIDEKWLRIGFSEKRRKTVSAKGRRETGEKGVGRLSADRLGAILELRTKKESSKAIGVSVDWDEFDKDGTDISSVIVKTLPDASPTLPPPYPSGTSKTGTEIIVRSLRQEWTPSDVENLEEELETLVAPKVGSDDFQIWLRSPGGQSRRLTSTIDSSAELSLSATFNAKGTMAFTITTKAQNGTAKRNVIQRGTVAWKEGVGNEALAEYSLGEVRVDLSFYLRTAASLEGSLTLQQLRGFLDKNAGVRIYRDAVRVKPYGDLKNADGDWLQLAARKNRNPAGAGRSSFRISANQLVGSVSIGRDTNPSLKDSAAREGLVHGEGFAMLRSAVFRCVLMLESTYHSSYIDKTTQSSGSTETIPDVVSNIKTSLAQVEQGLRSGAEPRKIIADATANLRAVNKTIKRAEQRFEEVANENIIYRGLATVGISSAVFGHETESALSQARMSTTYVMQELGLDEPDLEACADEIAKADDAVERITLWGQFSLNRVKRDKRRRSEINVSDLLRNIVKELKPIFEANRITLSTRITGGLIIRGFAMDIESLVLNLLTNGYHHAGLQRRDREVRITAVASAKLGTPGVRITVEDSGAGISKENTSRIWAPLFSTKSDQSGNLVGTGLGLSIVQSTIRDMGGSVQVEGKGPLGGASFDVVIPTAAKGGK